jgi:hypothetical protein
MIRVKRREIQTLHCSKRFNFLMEIMKGIFSITV